MEAKRLIKGKSVILRDNIVAAPSATDGERQAKRWTRRAKIIQDIEAPPQVCLEAVLDFRKYPKMVSLVKKLDVYDQINHTNVRFNLVYVHFP